MNLEARQEGYAAELEHYFRTVLVDEYDERARPLWGRDYSSTDAYAVSVQARRDEWRRLLGVPEFAVEGIETRESDVPGGLWLTVRLDRHLTAQGLLVAPEGATRLVVFQHGLGSTPERVMGLGDAKGTYDAVGQKLVDAGYAVLAPMNLIGIPPRNRAQSLARLAGTTMEGHEFARFQRLLAAVAEVAPEVDVDGYALTGMSWGGLAAQFWAPLDERASAVATLGFFNQRSNKMVVQDTRWSSFYDEAEDHAFLQGHLVGFGDADLASLVCPRPFLVQHGRADQIGWWPDVAEEFRKASAHWERLGVADRVSLQIHEGGHDVDAAGLVGWLDEQFPPRS
ncbi:dienelactone hydrolase family protein [Tessaracoccus oleiagri]|uniref:Alpha/beta hydrolase family protein n=1 Tax=Tessaracoccus oleiagri TaxID=686624 RepID=A0A1G9HHK5_9ACTN|nr:dienelactone hydrolase family protein [Tessaracoccus oleiagri]SDL11973.1 Alpha/beta hydrolase family protein [Tessaracoccus oleiagri]